MEASRHQTRTVPGLSGRKIAGNAISTLLGQVLPLLAGLALTPRLLAHLGSDRFGLLSLGWSILVLSLVFNLGVGRAATKLIAEMLGRDQLQDIHSIAWLAVISNTILGTLGGFVLAFGTRPLVHFLGIQPRLAPEGGAFFATLAFSIPFIFLATAFRSLLEAYQRFGLSNLLRGGFMALLFIIPAIVFIFGGDLEVAGKWIAVSRVAEAAACGLVCCRAIPALHIPSFNLRHARTIFSFGGWLTVSSLLQPLFVQMDRFLIGAWVSLAAVTAYSIPLDMVARLTILPASLAMPLFPAFSNAGVSEEGKRSVGKAYCRALRLVLLLMGGILAPVILFSHDLLRLWLGSSLPSDSSSVMQILSWGVLLNSAAYLPYTLLQSQGRADLTARFHMLEALVAVPSLWVCIRIGGIWGAALAWCLRVTLDFLLLQRGASHLIPPQEHSGSDRSWHEALAGSLATLAMAHILSAAPSVLWRLAGFTVLAVIYGTWAWCRILETSERRTIGNLLARAIARPVAAAGEGQS